MNNNINIISAENPPRNPQQHLKIKQPRSSFSNENISKSEHATKIIFFLVFLGDTEIFEKGKREKEKFLFFLFFVLFYFLVEDYKMKLEVHFAIHNTQLWCRELLCSEN